LGGRSTTTSTLSGGRHHSKVFDDDGGHEWRRAESVVPRAVRTPLAAVLAAAVVGAIASCTPCRRVETTPIELDCSANAEFVGELHLDTAASWRSFLTDRCLPEGRDAEIDALVDDVDFTVDAVFVARNLRQGASRCIEARAADSVDVCDEGLRVIFRDDESGDATCAGHWTVAFVLPRGELRAAVDDDDDDGDFDEGF